MGPITRRNDRIHPPKINTGVKLSEFQYFKHVARNETQIDVRTSRR
jgi:hypothetical protein